MKLAGGFRWPTSRTSNSIFCKQGFVFRNSFFPVCLRRDASVLMQPTVDSGSKSFRGERCILPLKTGRMLFCKACLM